MHISTGRELWTAKTYFTLTPKEKQSHLLQQMATIKNEITNKQIIQSVSRYSNCQQRSRSRPEYQVSAFMRLE